MGQKVNPHGLRVGVIKDWDSRWFVKDQDIGDTIVSDYKVRKYLKKTLFDAGIPKIEIERDPKRVRVFIHCAKPGQVIGRGGEEITKLRLAVEEIVKCPAVVNVVEVRTPDMSAQLVAENIAGQLERRIGFRRAMKLAIQRTMRLGAKGIKVSCGGRLGGAEIARTEHYHEGTIPLQTLRADIDYGFWEASTTYGKVGVKVWIYKGEVLADSANKGKRSFPDSKPAEQRDRRTGDRRGTGDRRPGGGFNRDNRDNRQGGGDRRTGGFNNNNNRQGGYNRNNRQGDAKPAFQGGNRVPGYKPQDRNTNAAAAATTETNAPAKEGSDS